MTYTKEFQRQQIGGVVPEGERDQCGYCGDWYTVKDEEWGVCPTHRGHAFNGLTSEGDYGED
jgi:hypothetical protein